MPSIIEHHVAKIDGIRFHYVTAGTGDPVLLLPGWPESWIAWRKVLPLLVGAGRSVVVLDPRGFGESDKPAGGYDLDTAARDLHGFLAATSLATSGGIDIIAHDVGTWIAHAHAVNYPADVKRLAVYARSLGLEVLLEIHNEEELGHICEETELVGVNNRDLKTFNVDVERSIQLSKKIPAGKIMIAESGISRVDTIVHLGKAGFRGFLIGENFMKEENPGAAFGAFAEELKKSIPL